MGIVFLQLALTAVVSQATVPVTYEASVHDASTYAASTYGASTYNEATCATVHGADADDWSRAAIGEDSTEPPTTAEDCLSLAPPPRLADCNDPMATVWFGEMIGTCDMPRGAGIPATALRADHGERRRTRLLVEVATGEAASQNGAPLAPPPDDRSPTPALAAIPPRLAVPTAFVLLEASQPRALDSIPGDTLLRPPRRIAG